MSDYDYTASFPIDDLPVYESPLKYAKKVWLNGELVYDEGQRMIAYDDIQPGYYAWRRNEAAQIEPIKIIDRGHGLQMVGYFFGPTECLYGEFLHRIEL